MTDYYSHYGLFTLATAKKHNIFFLIQSISDLLKVQRDVLVITISLSHLLKVQYDVLVIANAMY